jgi:branched-chain amino acid transport system substrate-binding protein
MNEWRAFMAKYVPDGDLKDGSYPFAYGIAQTLMKVLEQCRGDFSRESVMKQAASLNDFIPATTLPGIKVSTSTTNFHPIKQMQLQRWTGTTWERFGGVIEGANV